MCVLFQRRQVAAIGHQEILTGERDLGLNLRQSRASRAGLQAADQAQQPLLKLSPQDGADAQTTQRPALKGAYSPNPHRWAEGLSVRTLSSALTAIRVAVCMGR